MNEIGQDSLVDLNLNLCSEQEEGHQAAEWRKRKKKPTRGKGGQVQKQSGGNKQIL